MSDAANVVVEMCRSPYEIDGLPDRIILSTSEGGRCLPWAVQAALARCQSWGREGVLAQLVLTEMLNQRSQKTGSAQRLVSDGIEISTYSAETIYPLIVLNCDEQHVRFEAEDGEISRCWSFEEFATEPDHELRKSWMLNLKDRLDATPVVPTQFSRILTSRRTA